MTTELSKNPSSGMKIYFSNRWNTIKTGFLVLTWAAMGAHVELVGPTMSTLATNVKVDFNGMGSVLALRGIGYLSANILGAILQNIVKQHSDGVLICAFILPAIVVFATPFARSFILLCALFFFQGLGQGFTDLGGMNVLLTMWGANAAAPLNIVQLGYGLGAIFVNLLVRPFLGKKLTSINPIDDGGIDSSNNGTTTESDIVVPYSTTAGFCALMAIGYIYFYIHELKSRKQKQDVQQVDNPNSIDTMLLVDEEISSPYSPRTCGRGYFRYGLLLSILFICSIFFIGGNDQTFSKFFFTFLKFDKFNISTGLASWGIIIYWFSYSIGRFTVAIVSLSVSVTTCLNIVWFGGLCLVIVWLVFVWIVGLTGTSLLILGAISGLIFAPIIPLTFAYFNQRLNVVPILLALVLCGQALGIITFQKVAGFVMDHNSNHFPTLLVICVLVAIILYVLSNILYFFHQRKHSLNTRTAGPSAVVFSSEGLDEEQQQHTITYLRD